MSAEEILKVSEAAALKENQIIANVNGKKQTKKVGKKTGLGAAAFITAMLLVFLFFFSSGNIIPSAISERLIEEATATPQLHSYETASTRTNNS